MSTWTAVSDARAEQIDALEARVAELVLTLSELREAAEYNLYSPGNENDTIEYVSSRVSFVLGDDYTFVPEED